MRQKYTLFPRRPVGKIILLPKMSRALVLSGEASCCPLFSNGLTRRGLSDGTLQTFTLPSFDPVPNSIMSPLRGILSVILDDNELDWNGSGTEEKSVELSVILVRRKGLTIYRFGTRFAAVKVGSVIVL